MKITAVITILSAIALDTVNSVPTVRIINGEEVVPHSRPYQAAIFIPIRNNGRILCGGSLISHQTVMTSASCFKNNVGPVEVILGAHDMRIQELSQIRVNSSDILIHPESDGTPLNDIALVRLPEPIKFNENIQPISLPRDNSTDYESSRATVSGWGYIADVIREYAPALRSTKVTIVSNFGCEVSYLGDVDGNNLCVNGITTCVGDTGGPLTIENVQVGIVAKKNILACEDGWPAAYVRVAGFLDWIDTNMI